MRNIRAVAAVALLTTLPASSPAAPAASQARTARPPATVPLHATTGVVKSVDAHTLVITRSPRYGRSLTFVVDPSTEGVANVKVGSTVDVRYRTQADQHIATAVTVVQSRQVPSAAGPHR